MERWIVIGLSGVTSSGKTTLAKSLHQHFKNQLGHELQAGIELNRVELVNQDSYFRSVDDPNHQKVHKLNHLNWEILESIDMNKMVNDVMGILGNKFQLYNTRSSALVSNMHHDNLFRSNYGSNQKQQKPHFCLEGDETFLGDDQCNHKKIVKHNTLLNVLILEGFLIFNHPVTFDLCNVKYHLHVPYEVCYKRRSERTYDPPDVPCYFEMVVWPAYMQHLREFKDREDVLFLNGDAEPEKCFNFVVDSLMNEL